MVMVQFVPQEEVVEYGGCDAKRQFTKGVGAVLAANRLVKPAGQTQREKGKEGRRVKQVQREAERHQERGQGKNGVRKKKVRLVILSKEDLEERHHAANLEAKERKKRVAVALIQVQWRIARATHARRRRESATTIAAHFRGWRVRSALLRQLAASCVQLYWRSYVGRLHAAQHQLLVVAVLYIQRRWRVQDAERRALKQVLALQATAAFWERHGRLRAEVAARLAERARQMEQRRSASFVLLMAEVRSHRETQELLRQEREAAAQAQVVLIREAEARETIKTALTSHCLRRRIRKQVEAKKSLGVVDMQSFLLSSITGIILGGDEDDGTTATSVTSNTPGGGGRRRRAALLAAAATARGAPASFGAPAAELRRRPGGAGAGSTRRSPAPLGGYLLKKRSLMRLTPL